MTRIMASRRRSRSWVIQFVLRAQVSAVDVRIDLCGRDVGVPKHFLHGAEVGSPFKEMCRERVTQGVWRHTFVDAGPVHVLAQDLPRTHPAERGATRVEKERTASA